MVSDGDKKLLKWKTCAFKTWGIIGICMLAALVLYICGVLWMAVFTVILAALITFFLHGAVNRLEELGLPRWAGATVTFVILLAVLIGGIVAFIPALITQLSAFVSNLPNYMDRLQVFANGIYHKTSDLAQISTLLSQASTALQSNISTILQSLAGGLVGSMVSVGNAGIIFFMALLIAFWVLLDLPKISREIRNLVEDRYQDALTTISNAFGKAIYGWAQSTFLCAIITGALSGFAYWLCGIPYPAVLGFVCGLLYFIPYIGPAIGSAIVAVIALFVSPFICILSIIIGAIINNLVGSVLSPRLMKSSVNIHPAVILVVIMVGGGLGGVLGMLAAIPVTAAIQGIFITYYEAHTGKVIATEDGALFQKKPDKDFARFTRGFTPKTTHESSSQESADKEIPQDKR